MAYDVAVVGGGLAGAALSRALAEAGLSVVVLERERQFRDRVRGEQMHCWGVAEARALGIYPLLKETCGHEARFWSTQMFGGPLAPPRDLVATSPHQAGSLNFFHPEMQAILLAAAEAAGVEVRRGTQAVAVEPGRPPAVRVTGPSGDETLTPRLVVGADGRSSRVCASAGFRRERDPDRMVIAGVLLEGFAAPEDTVRLFIHSDRGLFSLTVPLGRSRVRAYVGCCRPAEPGRMSGHADLPRFIDLSIKAGVPETWFQGASPIGPLASFEGADHWVEKPWREGLVLVGDAAAASDPSFGCGLSKTLRDVRVLRDRLLAEGDVDAAGHAYAAEHDRYYGSLHRLTGWMTDLFYQPGPEAAALRARALPRIAQDFSRVPDIVGIGPDFPSDENARRRLFGED
jgi:menaquinone-9 beta-reductase